MHSDDLCLSAFFTYNFLILFLMNLGQHIIHHKMLLQSFGDIHFVISFDDASISVNFYFPILKLFNTSHHFDHALFLAITVLNFLFANFIVVRLVHKFFSELEVLNETQDEEAYLDNKHV